MIDYDFIDKLQKKLEDYYTTRYSALLNQKEYGDIREAQGYIKAIKYFGDLIAESNQITTRGKNDAV